MISKLKHLIWNQDEARLRMLWRLSAHTILVIFFINLYAIGLILLGEFVGGLFGFSLIDMISSTEPMQIIQSPWVGTIIIPSAICLGVVSGTYLSAKWFDRRAPQQFGIRFSKAWWVDFSFGLVLGAFLMIFIFLISWLTGVVRIVGFYRCFSENGSFISGFFQSLFFFILVGFYEELFSRGYHLINLAEGLNHKIIGKKSALIIAIIISSVLFGLLHVTNPHANWVSTLNVSLAGVFLGFGMYFTGSLAIPIGLHITWNFFQGNIFGFPVSGASTGATLIATQSVGPQWLMGGSFGPEAGVMGLVAMGIGIGMTLLWIRRKGRLSPAWNLSIYCRCGGEENFFKEN